MQFLSVDKSTKLADLQSQVGDALETFLNINGLKRTPNIGAAFDKLCKDTIANNGDVSYQRRASLLNSLTGDSDVFEIAALMSNDEWKILDYIGTIPGTLKVPEGVTLPDSTSVLGNGQPVLNEVYNKVISYFSRKEDVDPSVFNSYSSANPSKAAGFNTFTASTNKLSDPMQFFGLPWGMITMYSSLDDSKVDFPVYPEELSTGVKGNYTTMPDLLYQYEPWQIYSGSGPRTQSLTFHFHRDMWTGDHRDGKANELIRACEANCYPEYRGSAVNASTVTIYIDGKNFISGVMTDVNTSWSGPIGLDNWYLECKLELTITEVSKVPLNFTSVKQKAIIG